MPATDEACVRFPVQRHGTVIDGKLSGRCSGAVAGDQVPRRIDAVLPSRLFTISVVLQPGNPCRAANPASRSRRVARAYRCFAPGTGLAISFPWIGGPNVTANRLRSSYREGPPRGAALSNRPHRQGIAGAAIGGGTAGAWIACIRAGADQRHHRRRRRITRQSTDRSAG